MSRESDGPRIVIIGAGPAGLSTAYFLRKRGYQNVLVREKLGRVGGLCLSMTCGDHSFDLGANYVTPAYKEVLRLAEELAELTAAHDAGPPDPLLSTILAGAHLWRFITRQRSGLSRDEVVEALEASRRYGEEAVRLAPEDDTATAPSIVSLTSWTLNVLQGRPEANSAVDIDVLERSLVYPEFAGFIQGWLLAAMHKPGDSYFDQVELGYDVVLDACASPLPIPDPPRFNKLLHTIFALRVWRAPVCYENVAAPHNIEGMFFAMGDAWLKAGDIDRARIWYENVKTGPRYDSWKYKELLEDRLNDLEGYRRKFLGDTGKVLDVTEPAMQFQSENSCGVCHTL